MFSNKKVAGIDISKDTFNVSYCGSDSFYSNSPTGWNKFLKDVPCASVYAMEATGNYHYKLAVFLRKNGRKVMVFNPAGVHWWSKHLRNKAKTDRHDARLIARYANTEEALDLPDWEFLLPKLADARAIVSLLDGLSRLSLSSGNMGHALSYFLGKSNSLLSVMPSLVDFIKNLQSDLESRLCKLVSDVYPKPYRLLQTIPGIGAKTAAVMLASVRDICSFATSGQLVSFVGLVPSVKQSGTSVHAKGRIVKAGNIYLRGLLFMCSMTAISKCVPCKALYERLLSKGKPKKLALTAVMHRLVKIAYGVVKSGEPFRGGKI